jgi:predicted phosphodiesterase
MSVLEDEMEAARKAAEENTALAKEKRKTAEQAKVIKHLSSRNEELESLLGHISQIHPEDFTVVPWSKPSKKDATHHGTAVLMLSDLHLDEVVNPLEVRYRNGYNREIAEMRLARVGNGLVKLLKDYVAGIVLDGVVVALLGDIITGTIHDELARTNEAPVAATIAHWVPILAGLLQHLADELNVPVHVPTVDGNHDRYYQKTPSKQRTESSNAWIIYSWLADTLRNDPRITFNISVSPDNELKVYDTKFLLTHGDGFRSAGGVGGIYPSMLKYLMRAHEIYDFDMALMGHWHQLLWGPDFVVNGSLKGLDEYALGNRFRPERPQQAMFIVTPENGVTNRQNVFADSDDESWMKKRKR